MAATASEAHRVARQAASAGVVGAVNYVRRFAPGYRAAAADVRAERLGDIQVVWGIYTKGVLNNGSHMLDLLHMFFGDPGELAATRAFEEIAGDPTVGFTARYRSFTASIEPLRHDAHTIFELDTTDPMRLLNGLTSWAISEGVELEDLSVSKPSLEEIYLDLTKDSARE